MALSERAEKLAAPGCDPNALFIRALSDPWDAENNPDGFVNLGLAENSLMHHVILAHLRTLDIPSSALAYGDGQKRLRRAVARFLSRCLQPVVPIEPDHVVASNGCTSAIEKLAWALADPGDGILIGRPYYGVFSSDIEKRTGVEVLPLRLNGLDPMGLDAVARHEGPIEAAARRGQRVAAIILAHPHNPLGRCYSRDVLVAYMQLCQRRGIHLVSDEIYALSVFENRVDDEAAFVPFQSILSIDPTGIINPDRVHVLWGMSKDFGANGLRMGFTISQHSDGLRRALQAIFEFSWTSSLADLVTVKVLEDDAWTEAYMRENRRRLSLHHERVVRWAREHGIAYAPGSTAGFFLWVDLGAAYRRHHPGPVADIDRAVMDSLLAHRIFLADGVRFGAELPGWFCIIFSLDAAYLDHGLGRVLAAVRGESPPPPPTT